MLNGAYRSIGERTGFAVTLVVCIIAEICIFDLCGILFSHFHSGFTVDLPADLKCITDQGALVLGRLHNLPSGMEPFMYPPPILLLSAPLSLLPANFAYLLWSALGIALLCLAGWTIKTPTSLLIFAVMFPPCLYCLTLGETGLIPSALTILSLHWARQKPVRSGIVAGLLIIKPQTAFLLPICYAAARKPSAIIAAAFSGLAVCIGTYFAFGLHPWLYFFHTSLPVSRHVLQAGWHQNYQNLMASPFILLRSLGANLAVAYTVQGIVTICAAWLTWRLWRTGRRPDAELLFLTTCLAALATPYVYIYDLAGLGLLLLTVWPQNGWRLAAALAFTLGSSLYVLLSYRLFPMGALLIAGLCLAYWPAPKEPAS